MSKTKTLKVAVFAIFSVAIATFATQPAQAKFGLGLGYKYVGIASDLDYGANVGQLDFLWTIRGGGEGYRDGGKRPYQVFGFGVAIGATGGSSPSREIVDFVEGTKISYTGVPGQYIYFALPLLYEYVFPFGLGISGGITLPIMGGMRSNGRAGGLGFGFGVSDLGVSYHLKNGLTFYAKTNLGYTRFIAGGVNRQLKETGIRKSLNGFMWGVGAGIGYWF